MHGYQIRTLIEKMYLIQRLIVEQNWDELKKTCKIACEVEEILYEINQYPGKITCCENINDFFDTLVLGDFDGFNIYATIFGMIMSKVIYLWNVMQSFMVDY